MLMLIKTMLTSTKFQCNYCNAVFNKSQGLSRHKKTAKFCLNKRLIADEVKTLVEEEEPVESLEKKQIRALMEENELLKTQVNIYKPFYVKHMLTDTDTLEYFDIELCTGGLCDYIYSIVGAKNNPLEILDPSLCYSYMFPKYWRSINVKDDVYKYRDSSGNVLVDENLKHLYKTIKGSYLWVLLEITEKLSLENETKRSEYDEFYDKQLLEYDDRLRFFYSDVLNIECPTARKLNNDLSRSLRKLFK